MKRVSELTQKWCNPSHRIQLGSSKINSLKTHQLVVTKEVTMMLKGSKTRLVILSGLVVLSGLLVACTDAPAGYSPAAAQTQPQTDKPVTQTMAQRSQDNALMAYVAIDGVKQGKFKGESSKLTHRDTIGVVGFNYEVVSPRDAATGQATGKRQFSPITFTKEWGAASPQLLQALYSNETLKTVTFEFYRLDASGKEYVYQAVTLTNANVAKINKEGGNLPSGKSVDTYELETISLTFQKIEITDSQGKTSAIDDWSK